MNTPPSPEMTFRKVIVRNALLMVLNVTLNRGNVVFTGMAEAAGTTYFPSASRTVPLHPA